MKRDEVLRRLNGHKDRLEQLQVKSLALFGSVARGEEHLESDLDILVEFQGAATFDQYMDLKFFLEDLLKQKVDLVTKKALRSRIRPQVEEEAVYIT